MALVNPQIAMSYRPTTEYQPRNALAEYAQIQSIVGGQRQAEVADMQLRRMQQEDAEIERIHQIAMRHGGPDNRLEMGRALFASRNPQQRELGYKIIQHEDAKKMFAEAENRFGYGPTGAAAPAAAAATTAAPAPGGDLVAAPIAPQTGVMREIAPGGAAGPETPLSYLKRQFGTPGAPAPAEGVNALPAAVGVSAPAAAPATNAMLAPSAAPVTGARVAPAAAPAAALTGLGGKTLAQLQQEQRTYSQLEQLGAPGAKGRLEEIKREIDFIYKTSEPGADQKLMRDLNIPLTEAGFTKFQRLKDSPSELTKLLDGLNLSPAQRREFELRMAQKLVTHAPSPQQNVFAYTPASEVAQQDFMRGARATYDTLKNAPATLKNIDAAKELIPSAAGFMGPGGEPLLKAASFLNNRFGMSISTKGVTDATELRSRLFAGVIDNLRKLDAQPTQAQQQALQDAIGNLGTDPSALPRVLDAMAQSVRDKVDLYNRDVTGAEQRGVRFPYKPQIDLPPPKSTPGAAAQQIPGAASTTPSNGNTVSLPDGRVMTFPNAKAAAEFKKAARLP